MVSLLLTILAWLVAITFGCLLLVGAAILFGLVTEPITAAFDRTRFGKWLLDRAERQRRDQYR